MKNYNHAYHGLRDGEELLWTGEPCEYKDYGASDRVLLPVSMILLALSTFFGAFEIVSIARTGFQFSDLVAIILLLVVGGMSVYAVFFRFIFKRRRKSDLSYGVTSQGRELNCDHDEVRTYAYDPKEAREAAVTESDKQGTGTIYLIPKKAKNWLDNTGLEFFAGHDGSHVALFDVPDCERVLKLIKSAGARIVRG